MKKQFLLLFCLVLSLSGVVRAQDVEEDRDEHLRRVVLDSVCADPMQLAIALDGRVLYIERGGALKIWEPGTKKTVVAAHFDVNYHYNGTKDTAWEDGVIGLALDPSFKENHWLYLYYTPTNGTENLLSRFILDGNTLDLGSEKVILRVRTDRNVCCHAAGSIAFDSARNLYLSTGDNTNPFESDGYAPIDYRPGRYGWDAARSAANTDDLRGKILRIHPEQNGAYTIPTGNLFAPGTPKTRSEIYVMGCRNPFRITVDSSTDTLYWGDVGPDSQQLNPDRGPAGLDCFDRTREAANFGWPFVRGENKAYRAWDFASGKAGDVFDPAKPVNLSPNNTGMQTLPPVRPAWAWYPYAPSTRFPELGSGGRAACAGPVYFFDEHSTAPNKLPRRFDHHLFLFDWERGWIKAVNLDDKGPRPAFEAFATKLKFKHPIELKLGSDGCLYLIEFGTGWEHNKDSRIERLEWVE